MPKQLIIPAGSPPPIAPYSPGIRAENVVYVSGMVSLDNDGNVAAVGDAAGQTRIVLEAIKTIVEEAGGNMTDVAYNVIILKDMSDYAAMNAIYAEYFPEDPPARYCFQAQLVKPEFLVEIASIAHL